VQDHLILHAEKLKLFIQMMQSELLAGSKQHSLFCLVFQVKILIDYFNQLEDYATSSPCCQTKIGRKTQDIAAKDGGIVAKIGWKTRSGWETNENTLRDFKAW
jgi:hypothetical protein